MAATFGPCNAVLATAIEHHNLGSTCTFNGTAWVVSHPSRLVIPVEVGQQSGYTASYSTPPNAWATALRDMVTQGHIAKHTFAEMVIEDGAGDDMPFAESTQPTFEESTERPATTWRKRVRDDYGVIG